MPNIYDMFPSIRALFKSDVHPSIGHEAVNDIWSYTDKTSQRIFEGVIVEAIQWMNFYWVDANFRGRTPCKALEGTIDSPYCYQSQHGFVVGSRVLVYQDQPGATGTILGVVNSPTCDAAMNLCDWVFMQSATGFLQDKVHSTIPLGSPTANYTVNYNAGQPCDAFQGDMGWFNALGMGLNMGTLSMVLRATDLASITFSYLDHYVRLAAHHYDFWTASREESSQYDQGENIELRRGTPFPWEMIGARTYKQSVTQTSSGEWQADNFSMPIAPNFPDQMGIFRDHKISGFLGDAERKILASPPATLSGPERLSNLTPYIGLSDVHRAADGTLSFRSAKGIHFEKVIKIPVPKQIHTPDDPAGDSVTAGNYLASGVIGTTTPLPLNDYTFGQPGSPQARASQLYDQLAWTGNFTHYAAMVAHKLDWFLWNDSQAPAEIAGPTIDSKIFAPLGNNFSSQPPSSVQIAVDERKGNTHTYYHGRSMVSMLDDGSILLEDAYGSSINMSGGNIFISCQGDIVMQPGRSIVGLAPRDVIMRGGNCVDISAALGDVRVKAERNMQVVGGNSGYGGVLIESRAKTSSNQYESVAGTDVVSSGISLVARNSTVGAYGNGIYLRTFANGPFTLDAGGGQGTLNMVGANVTATVTQGVNYIFGVTADQGGEPTSVESHTGNNIIFGQTGELLFNAAAITAPNAEAVLGKSVIANSFTQNSKPSMVGGPWPSSVNAALSAASGAISDIGTALNTQMSSLVSATYEDSGAPAAQSLLNNIGFSFRTDTQYGVGALKLFETRWQQAFRNTGAGTPWNEPTVQALGISSPTAPWPGYTTWANSLAYGTFNSALWDSQTWQNTDRPYNVSSSTGNVAMHTLQSSYLVNLQQ